MGGKALKEYGVTRISTVDYKRRLDQLSAYMRDLPEGVECRWFVPGGVHKEDHGDMDVLYTSANPAAVVSHFKRIFGSIGARKNGNVNSIEWSGFQVDLIHIPADSFEFACHYYAHGTFAALVGKLARYYGFKLGWQGLSVYVQTKHRQHEELITSDWNEAMAFLGYAYYLEPSETFSVQDLYEHLIDSPLIHKRIFKTSRPDRNYGFQEEFFEWIDIQAKVPDNAKSRAFGWLMITKHHWPTGLRLLQEYGNMHLSDWGQPVKRWWRKLKFTKLYPLACKIWGWV